MTEAAKGESGLDNVVDIVPKIIENEKIPKIRGVGSKEVIDLVPSIVRNQRIIKYQEKLEQDWYIGESSDEL